MYYALGTLDINKKNLVQKPQERKNCKELSIEGR
jgi:hypothetical protein